VSTASRGPAETSVDASQSSVGDLLSEITRDMSKLIRKEMELAKAELRQEATKGGKAAGMFGGGALAGYMTLLFLSFALWWGLANVMDQGWAALIVAATWALIAAILFAVARARMREIRGLPQTTETAREVPAALKGH
jgi:ABC-type multidrug transport system fused ATPase/permease subunit